MSLLSEIEKHTGDVIEKEMGQKIVLIDEDGKHYDKSALDPTEDLKGMIVQESLEYDANTGMEVVSNNPVVTVRIRSLERVPDDGEKWVVRIPESIHSEKFKSYTVAGPPRPSKSIGFINLKLQGTSQI